MINLKCLLLGHKPIKAWFPESPNAPIKYQCGRCLKVIEVKKNG